LNQRSRIPRTRLLRSCWSHTGASESLLARKLQSKSLWLSPCLTLKTPCQKQSLCPT